MSKQDWLAAKAELEAIEKERAELLAPTQERYNAVRDLMEVIEEETPDCLGQCEGCLKAVWADEPYSYDTNNGLTFCEECSPTYQDMLDTPDSFLDNDDEYMSPEQAKAVVDAHIAAGGKLSDKMVTRPA